MTFKCVYIVMIGVILVCIAKREENGNVMQI